MQFLSGIPLLFLIVTTESTRSPWSSTQTRAADAPTASWSVSPSPVTLTSTATVTTATPAATIAVLRSHDAMEAEARDNHDDETCRAAPGGDVLPTAPDNAPLAEGARSGARLDSASTRKRTTPSGGRATDDRSGELSVAAGAPVGNTWLPAWCRHWPRSGPLGVPHSTLLQAFSEALSDYTAGINGYWAQTGEPADADRGRGIESVAMEQVNALHEFCNWMYLHLTATEPEDRSAPESLGHFLDALEDQATLVESVRHLLPPMQLLGYAADTGIVRGFFWAMERQLNWVRMFQTWAATKYDLAAAAPTRWWMPFGLNAVAPPPDASQLSTRDRAAGNSTSAVEATGDRFCTVGDRRGGTERALAATEDMSSVTTAHRNCRSVPRVQIYGPHNGKGKFGSCVLQSIAAGRNETGTLTGTERTPIRDLGTEAPRVEGGGESEPVRAPPLLRLDSPGVIADVNANEMFGANFVPVLTLEDALAGNTAMEVQEIQPEDLDDCPKRIFWQMLGPEFEPPHVMYVECSESEDACVLPQRCTPQNVQVVLQMLPTATLPEFPHTFVSSWEAPSGQVVLTLSVARSCRCLEPSD